MLQEMVGKHQSTILLLNGNSHFLPRFREKNPFRRPWRLDPGSAGDQASGRCHGGSGFFVAFFSDFFSLVVSWLQRLGVVDVVDFSPHKMVVDSLTWVGCWLREVEDFLWPRKSKQRRITEFFFRYFLNVFVLGVLEVFKENSERNL